MISSRELRHRVHIERPVNTMDATTGVMRSSWTRVWSDVPAKISPLSVREFIASQAMQSGITTRITIRYRDGLTASMRILHGSRVYNPQGWLSDPDSGVEYVTAACTEGVNRG